MEQGWDPGVKKYFRKILSTIGWGMLWIMLVLTAGFYFGLAHSSNILICVFFYTAFGISLFLLLRYYYRLWTK